MSAFVHRERQPGEPVWKTMDRLVGELIERRASMQMGGYGRGVADV
jgi:hypothetical protein